MSNEQQSPPHSVITETEHKQKMEALMRLLQSWREGDEKEQQETLAYLQKALDEDRLSDRKLFS